MNLDNSKDDFHTKFCSWLDSLLSEELSEDINGFAINLYEGSSIWEAELVGTPTFDEDDDDWACDEIYKSDRLEIPQHSVNSGWEGVLDDVVSSFRVYLSNNSVCVKRLLKAKGIAIGFVEGDLIIIDHRSYNNAFQRID